MHPFHRFAQLPDLRRFGHLRLLLFCQSIITLCAARWTL